MNIKINKTKPKIIKPYIIGDGDQNTNIWQIKLIQLNKSDIWKASLCLIITDKEPFIKNYIKTILPYIRGTFHKKLYMKCFSAQKERDKTK